MIERIWIYCWKKDEKGHIFSETFQLSVHICAPMVFMSYPFYPYLAISSHQLSEDPGAHATQKRPGPRVSRATGRNGSEGFRGRSNRGVGAPLGGFNRGFQMSLTRAKWELMLVGGFNMF